MPGAGLPNDPNRTGIQRGVQHSTTYKHHVRMTSANTDLSYSPCGKFALFSVCVKRRLHFANGCYNRLARQRRHNRLKSVNGLIHATGHVTIRFAISHFLYRCSIVTEPLSPTVFTIIIIIIIIIHIRVFPRSWEYSPRLNACTRTHLFTNKQTNKQTNKHGGSQYLPLGGNYNFKLCKARVYC